jgi:hypothetical protein
VIPPLYSKLVRNIRLLNDELGDGLAIDGRLRKASLLIFASLKSRAPKGTKPKRRLSPSARDAAGAAWIQCVERWWRVSAGAVEGRNPRPLVGVAQSANVAELVYAPDLGSLQTHTAGYFHAASR